MINPIVEERFEYKGFSCVVLFLPWGYRCGYVGLPSNNEYYNVDYMNIPVDCHGGLTYAESSLCMQDDKDIWWIGFDCAHCFDGYDLEKHKEYYKDNAEAMKYIDLSKDYYVQLTRECGFRDFDYVKKECMGIVDQLLNEESEE